MDIMTGEICRQFRLLTWTSFISQFVYPVRGEGWGKGYLGIVPFVTSLLMGRFGVFLQ